MIHGLGLCSGVGALELALDLVLGRDGFRTVCYVEREAYAAASLVARMGDEALDLAPIWDDIFSFDPRPWRGKVDIVSAGFPCQPFSVAGKRRAESDERHLFPRIAEIIRDVGPRLVFLENVRGLLTASGGRVFGDVLGTLADIGFDSEWLCLKASDVGAPHRRERVFILGVSDTVSDPLRIEPRWIGGANREGAALARDAGEDMDYAPFPPGPDDRDAWARVLAERPDLAPALADGDGSRLEGRSVRGAGRSDESPPRTGGGAVADGERGPGEQFGATGRMGREGEPIPRDGNGEGEAQSKLCGVADGLSARVDACRKERLRACGNGVVPLQAGAAFVVLARRAGLMK